MCYNRATNDNITTATFELDTENPVDGAVEFAEVLELGPRIQAYKVEAQVNSDWKLLSQGTDVGPLVDKFPKETLWEVKITITKQLDT